MLTIYCGSRTGPAEDAFDALIEDPRFAGSIYFKPMTGRHGTDQSNFGASLALEAMKRDIYLMTHSADLINGIRVAVKNGVPPELIRFRFFGDGEEPVMFEDGGIMPWPLGFFDTANRDLRKLL